MGNSGYSVEGLQGNEGPIGSTWRAGSGVPSNSVGQDSDFWLDNSTGNVYERIAGVYSLQCNIKGPLLSGSNFTAGPIDPQTIAPPVNGDIWLDTQ